VSMFLHFVILNKSLYKSMVLLKYTIGYIISIVGTGRL